MRGVLAEAHRRYDETRATIARTSALEHSDETAGTTDESVRSCSLSIDQGPVVAGDVERVSVLAHHATTGTMTSR